MTSQPFVGEIGLYPFNLVPRGWAACNGQLLAIAQNQALFSLLGTVYGGDGRTTFGLPDLRGRMAAHFSGSVPIGEGFGEAAHTLNTNEIPSHNHAVNVATTANTPTVAGSLYAATGSAQFTSQPATGTLAAGTVASAGGSQPHDNMSPYLVLQYCIALTGIYPSRS